MADDRPLQPLAQNFKIVDENGFPTLYFIEWAQQRQIDIGAGITAEQAQELIDTWAAGRQIIAGDGLSGGGTLDADVTLTADGVTVQQNGADVAANVFTINFTGSGVTVTETAPGVVEVNITGGGPTPGTGPTLIGADVVYVNNSGTVNVPLPAGCAIGDVCVYIASHGYSVSDPSGFTNLSTLSGSNCNGGAAYKALDAIDIANGYITGNFGGGYYGAASVTVFEAATVAGVSLASAQRHGGSSTPVNITTGIPIAVTDTIVTFGGARGNGFVSFANAVYEDGVINNEGSASLGLFTPTVGGSPDAETITFADDPGGNYAALIIVSG